MQSDSQPGCAKVSFYPWEKAVDGENSSRFTVIGSEE